jgi:hypothetical protein
MLFVFASPIFQIGQLAQAVPITRHWFATASVLGLITLPLTLVASPATDIVDFRPATQVGSYRQIKVVVEVEGKLKLNADGQDVKHLPIKVQGELQYVERVLSQAKQWNDVRLVRTYQSARANIRLHESDLTNGLRPERRLIAVESGDKAAVLFSPQGPITREELELIELAGSGLALEALLPPRVQKIGSQWPLRDTTVARLLGLEAVSQQDVACTFDSVKEGVAIVSLAGKITGAVGGVSSDIELKGKLNFDLRQRAVTWLTLAYKENRAIGHAQPGFDVMTTLRMVSAPSQPIADLSDKVLSGLALKPNGSQTLIELNSASGGFQLTHDRRWSVMLERHDVTVLRLIDRGDLIAQCNITPRPPLGKDEQFTMEGFQDDVKRVLSKNFEEMVEATEETSDSGMRVLRVVVAGKVGELPIQWTYYHLSDNKGRRASLVFTLESSLLDRFAHIDRELIGNFRFLQDKQPTPAGETKSAKREPASSLRMR